MKTTIEFIRIDEGLPKFGVPVLVRLKETGGFDTVGLLGFGKQLLWICLDWDGKQYETRYQARAYDPLEYAFDEVSEWAYLPDFEEG